MKKIIYLKCKIEVKIGDLIDLDGVNVRVTQELIKDNPELFEIKESVPEYVKCIRSSISISNLLLGNIYKLTEPDCNGQQSIHGVCMVGSISYNNCFKPCTKEEFDIQELTKEAGRRYPIGTRVDQRTAYAKFGGVYTISSSNVQVKLSAGHLNVTVGIIGVYNSEQGKWAETLNPICKTVDGVDLYKGDTYWFSYKKRPNVCGTDIAGGGHNSWLANKFDGLNKLIFSTEESCKEYNKNNTPKTLKDYENILLCKSINDNYNWFKLYEPKLYWWKVLSLIAKDINGEFRKHYYEISEVNGEFEINKYPLNTFIITNLEIRFSSEEKAEYAKNLMGDKLKYLFK